MSKTRRYSFKVREAKYEGYVWGKIVIGTWNALPGVAVEADKRPL